MWKFNLRQFTEEECSGNTLRGNQTDVQTIRPQGTHQTLWFGGISEARTGTRMSMDLENRFDLWFNVKIISFSANVFFSLSGSAWTCLKVGRRCWLGGTGWRRSSVKSCSSKLTNTWWMPAGCSRRCRTAASWRSLNQSFRGFSAEKQRCFSRIPVQVGE